MSSLPIKIKKIVPLFDSVLVKQIPILTKTRHGSLIPESAIKSQSKFFAKVVSIGKLSAENDITGILKEGDTVLMPEYEGVDVPSFDASSNDKHYIIAIDKILAKVDVEEAE